MSPVAAGSRVPPCPTLNGHGAARCHRPDRGGLRGALAGDVMPAGLSTSHTAAGPAASPECHCRRSLLELASARGRQGGFAAGVLEFALSQRKPAQCIFLVLTAGQRVNIAAQA
eukprot:CAMPEP_0206317968 /NCGR_PEP_ID=MMETSP0106_2-20121207/16920_1 /ASSEMBLY_ACC=CAM_ASM_000206 /TAXON_ID=81532 /ORGANISM="Acanthoeca-like sp., Strain 10tr" /LENGTH=113 /DNA_ID=CAMNT_0053749599 /DNA_START=771 /DNA_END=1109 /DNA_ORIENTATION=-